MLKTINSWIYIIAKKSIVNRSFLILLIIIPLLCFGLGKANLSKAADEAPLIYLYVDSDDETANIIIDNLEGERDGYTFERVDSYDDLVHDVRHHKALCGFVFADDLTERIIDGKIKDNITIVQRVGSIRSDIVTELVFSAYYKEYARVYTPVYMNLGEDSEFSNQYNDILGETMFNYSIETLEAEESVNPATSFIRSAIAILMCLMAMLLNVEFINDSRNGIFYPVKKDKRIYFRILYFMIPLLMVTPFAFLGIILGNVMKSVIYEVGKLLLYVGLLTLISFGLSYVIKSRKLIVAAIPILTIIYLVVLPVFVDLSKFIAFIKVLKYLCPPFYYL